MHKRPFQHELETVDPVKITIHVDGYADGYEPIEFSPDEKGDSVMFRFKHIDDNGSHCDYDAACDYLCAAVQRLAELEPDEITELLARFSLAAKDGAAADWHRIRCTPASTSLF